MPAPDISGARYTWIRIPMDMHPPLYPLPLPSYLSLSLALARSRSRSRSRTRSRTLTVSVSVSVSLSPLSHVCHLAEPADR